MWYMVYGPSLRVRSVLKVVAGWHAVGAQVLAAAGARLPASGFRFSGFSTFGVASTRSPHVPKHSRLWLWPPRR